jgi:hypothetical protein
MSVSVSFFSTSLAALAAAVLPARSANLPRGLRTQVLVTLVGQAGIAGRLRADRHLAKIEFLRFRHGRFLEHGQVGSPEDSKMRQIVERRL